MRLQQTSRPRGFRTAIICILKYIDLYKKYPIELTDNVSS